MDAVIVGAGPTGLTAALELNRHGLTAVIIEKRPDPSQLSRAVGIQPASMEIFARSGAAMNIDAEAVRFRGMIMHRGAQRLGRFPLNFDERSRIWGLPQDRTEYHLRAALSERGLAPSYGVAFQSFEQDDDGVTVTTSDGTLRARFLVGADGSHSSVREGTGIAFPGHDLPETWSIADVLAEDWPEPDFFQGFLLPKGQVCVVVPMAPKRFRVIAGAEDALAALPVPMTVLDIKRSGTFTISVRQAVRYRHGRVFLAGDAAHCHSPVGGRGMNLGIADAAELAARISAGDLDGYEKARHPQGAHVIDLSERGRRLIQSTRPAARAAVIFGIQFAARIPPVGRALMRKLISG